MAKQAPDSPSIGLDGRKPSEEVLRLRSVAFSLLGRQPVSAHDFDAIAARLAKAIKRRKPYDGYYIRSVMNGDNPMTYPLDKAADNLAAELVAEPPEVEYQSVIVKVPNGVKVPPGTVVLRDAETCICGVSFIPTIWNQINHTRACAIRRSRVGSVQQGTS